MKWIACLALFAACQTGEDARQEPGSTKMLQLPRPQVTTPYRTDIATLCDVVQLSGANQAPKDERWQIIAMYLGPHLSTSEAHDFLVAIQPLQGEGKALALETEAKRVGLPKCELANEWRK